MIRFPTREFGRGGQAPAVGTADFFRGFAYVRGRNKNDYWLGWTEAEGAVVSYEYSLDAGGSWTSTGTTPWVHVTGRTPSTTDQTRVRAVYIGGYSATTLSLAITTKSPSDPVTIVSVIGTIANPFNGGGACDYPSPDLWEADGPTIAGNASLVVANVELEGWLLRQEYLNKLCVIEGMASSATCRRRITTGPGQSFRHRGDRRTARLGYDATRGAAMRLASVLVGNPIIDLRERGAIGDGGIQLASVGNGSSTFGGWGIHTSATSGEVYIDDIFGVSGTPEFVCSANHYAHPVTNCIFVNNRPTSQSAPDNNSEQNNGVLNTNVIFVSLGGTPLVDTVARTNLCYFTDCALLGATYLHNVQNGGKPGAEAGTGVPNYSNCFTDTAQAVDGSGSVVGLPGGVTQISMTGLFENTSPLLATMDMRPKAGSALLAAGVTGCW